MIITQTPLRVSFLGGGTDLPQYFAAEPGAVLSCTIDKYIYVIVKRRFDDRLRVGYTRTELVGRPSELEHELVREALLVTGIRGGVEISTMGDIPSQGSGLGSSSTVTVGLLHALRLHAGELPTRRALAEDACRVEIDALARPMGLQDQYAAAYGGLRTYQFGPDGVTVGPALTDGRLLRRIEESLLLFYTGVTRRSASILAGQVARVDQRRESLRTLRGLVDDGWTAVQRGDIAALGALLDEAWCLKRGLATGITNPDIDRMVESAKGVGALGCKVCGAGGGGFLLVACLPDRQPAVRAALRGFDELSFSLEPEGTRVLANVARGPYWQTNARAEPGG